MILPPPLRPGSRVALVAPAGPVDESIIDTALRRCEALGLEPVPGASIRSRTAYLAGSDEDRAGDLQRAIAGDVAAIWALRGGYGTLRTLDHVDLTPMTRRPKAFIGFSDNTAVHLALSRLGVVSYHGPHAGYRHFPSTTERVFRAVLMEGGAAGRLPLPPNAAPRTLVPGTAEGPLVGGNLAMVAATCGTRLQPDTRGRILVLEDVDEHAYRVDRMLVQLRLAGVLDAVAGIALGDFTTPDDERPDQKRSLDELFTELLAPVGVPVVRGLPFGHGPENWTLPFGVRARLDAEPPALTLLDPANQERPQ